jgi:hypothetical protein
MNEAPNFNPEPTKIGPEEAIIRTENLEKQSVTVTYTNNLTKGHDKITSITALTLEDADKEFFKNYPEFDNDSSRVSRAIVNN